MIKKKPVPDNAFPPPKLPADLQTTAPADGMKVDSREKYRILLDTMTEGAALNEIVYDENGEMVDYRIAEVNPAFYQVADFTGPVVGSVATQLYGMSVETIKAFWREHKTKNTVQRTEMTSPIGGRHFIISTSPFVNDLFVTSFFDDTERPVVADDS